MGISDGSAPVLGATAPAIERQPQPVLLPQEEHV
jgi:hypothetical protein